LRVISPKRIYEACDEFGNADLAKDLNAWLQTVKAAHWQNFVELRQTFSTADHVDGLVIFNIRRNRFRLVTRVIYSRWSEPDQQRTPGQVLIGAILTHADYDRWSHLSAQKRKEQIWPPRSQIRPK
jgi:mRNA interferase HigB